MNSCVLNIEMPATAPSVTRMVLLGLLCRYGPKYGYELKALIKEQNLNRITDIQFGSIYSTLKRLARDGLVVEVERSRSGNRPERIAFDVTDDGRKEMRSLIGEALCATRQTERAVDIGVHFSSLLALDEVAPLLRRRLEALEDYQRRFFGQPVPTDHPHPGVRVLIQDIAAHFETVNLAEISWTRRVLARVEDDGGYPTPGKKLKD